MGGLALCQGWSEGSEHKGGTITWKLWAGLRTGKVVVGALEGSGGGSVGHCAQPNHSDSHVHWVTLMEEASNEPFTAVTCTANLLPASR